MGWKKKKDGEQVVQSGGSKQDTIACAQCSGEIWLAYASVCDQCGRAFHAGCKRLHIKKEHPGV